jgi:hypothetical protein
MNVLPVRREFSISSTRSLNLETFRGMAPCARDRRGATVREGPPRRAATLMERTWGVRNGLGTSPPVDGRPAAQKLELLWCPATGALRASLNPGAPGLGERS